MPLEYLHPYRMGYRPVLVTQADELPDWQDVMIEMAHYGSDDNASTMNRFLKDQRAATMRAIRMRCSAIPALVEYRDRTPNLDTIFLENSFHSDEIAGEPTDLLNAFPGLGKLYIKDRLNSPAEPLRHIGLDYLGLVIDSIHKKRLHDLVLPNLKILSINFGGLHGFTNPEFEEVPETHKVDPQETVNKLVNDLVYVMTGELFPRIERLHIKGCHFINQLLIAAFTKNQKPLKIQQLDIMDSHQAISYDRYHLVDLTPIAESPFRQRLKINLDDEIDDEANKTIGENLRTGVDVLPY